MSKYLLGLVAVLMVGCGSAPVERPMEKPKVPSTEASEAGPDETKNDSSEVLNKNRKCPKKSKMVNGKCTLQVESDE